MGKKWDYDVPSIEIWQEVLRVLKPGGHLLAFAGTRTQHRMAVRIEDAGFEIRDMIAWVYGSGFPKSLNIGKAIDKDNGKKKNLRNFTKWFSGVSKDKTSKEIDKFLGLDSNGATASHYRCVDGQQPRFPRLAHYYKLQEWLGFDDTWDETIKEAEREVIGKTKTNLTVYQNIGGENESGEIDITTPATPEAKQWEGWGTALKPALEPITVARKPLEGTVAENCLKWGVGGINIDGCRVETEDNLNGGIYSKGEFVENPNEIFGERRKVPGGYNQPSGRFPANLIHDNSEEVRECFPDTKSGMMKQHIEGGQYNVYGKMYPRDVETIGDSGNASRFFKSIIYQAKASKSERNKGCEELEAQSNMRVNAPRENEEEKTANKMGNHHPTIKPIALMEYLIKMVTPKGGIVLDPFIGSGTTGIAARQQGYDFIGIEREPEYIKIAEARIAAVKKPLPTLL